MLERILIRSFFGELAVLVELVLFKRCVCLVFCDSVLVFGRFADSFFGACSLFFEFIPERSFLLQFTLDSFCFFGFCNKSLFLVDTLAQLG